MQLRATQGNILLKVDIEKKNVHRFADGTEIKLERNWNNFDGRQTNPVQGIVIDADCNIPAGAEILFQHTCFHPSYELFNLDKLSGDAIASEVRYFSVPVELCFAWRVEYGEWQPMEGFLITTRCWQPYEGFLVMPPNLIKQRLYVKEGAEYLKGKVVVTLKHCDYEIIFQGDNGRENYLISTKEETEVIAIDDNLTEKALNGEILIGRTESEAQPLTENILA